MSQGVRPGGCCRVPAPAPTPGGEEGRLILLLSCSVLLISTPEFPSVGSTQQQLTPPPLLAHLNSLRQRLPSSERGAAEIFSPPASNLTTAPISTAGIHPTMAQPHQCFSCHFHQVLQIWTTPKHMWGRKVLTQHQHKVLPTPVPWFSCFSPHVLSANL